MTLRLTIILIILFPLTGLAQKFMIKNNDTLPYSQTMEIHSDTLYLGDNVIYPGDTTYSHPCQTFEKLNGQIINVTKEDCLPIGLWIIRNKNGTISKGQYTSWGRRTGIWKTFDKDRRLIKESEYASVAKDTYVLRQVEYKDGQTTIISEKTWFARFYLRNVLLIAFIILGAFFIRVPINMIIISRQYGQKPVFWFPLVTSFTDSGRYMIATMFTFWWSKLKSENKKLGQLSNLLSVIAIGGFFVVIIGLAISGEI